MNQKAKPAARPGSGYIFRGWVLAIAGVLLYVLAVASGGAGNPLLSFGVVVVGLILVGIGYLKRNAERV